MHKKKFLGQGKFHGTKHFDKQRLHNYATTFWKENLTRKWTQSWPFFFSKIKVCRRCCCCFFVFFQSSKKSRPGLPPPPQLYACEYQWIYIHQYIWISLNIPENGSEYARSSYRFNRLLQMPSVMCQSSKYGTVVYVRVTQSSEYVWIWFNMPQ